MEKRPRQPLAVTLTACGVLILGAGYALGAVHSILAYSTLESLPLSVPAWYFAFSGIGWAGLWFTLGAALGWGKEWGRRAVLAALPVQYIAWLADERLLSRSAIALQSFGFEAVLRLILTGIGMAVLFGVERLETNGPNPDARGQDLSMEKTTTHAE